MEYKKLNNFLGEAVTYAINLDSHSKNDVLFFSRSSIILNAYSQHLAWGFKNSNKYVHLYNLSNNGTLSNIDSGNSHLVKNQKNWILSDHKDVAPSDGIHLDGMANIHRALGPQVINYSITHPIIQVHSILTRLMSA